MSDVTSKNKTLMRRVYDEMWNQGNPAAAAAIFEKPASVEKFVGGFLSSFPDLHHTVEEMIADGDRVVVKFSARGTHTGPWLNFAATGKSIQYTGLTWARVANGKIAEHQTEWDKAGLMEQIGG
jgi:steroid delta-isomerase-like uncharacterized protein